MEDNTSQNFENEVVAEAITGEDTFGFTGETVAGENSEQPVIKAGKMSMLEKRKVRAENLAKLKNLPKNDKIIWAILIAIGIIYIGITVGKLIDAYVAMARGGESRRIFTYYMSIGVFILPLIIEPIFKVRLNKFLLGVFWFYALFAVLFGEVFAWYEWDALHMGATKESFGFDKIMHVALGWMACLLGMIALCKTTDISKLKPMVVVFFVVGISMTVGCVWEILEFTADSFLGQTSQGIPVKVLMNDGTFAEKILIYDTVRDIMSNTVGAIIFGVHYLIHKKTGKDLGMGTIVKNCIG